MTTTAPHATPYSPTVDKVGASKILGCAPRTLDNWRSQGRGPRYVRVGRRIVYRLSDLREWMEERTVETGNR